MTALAIRDLTVVYPNGHRALESISLHVHAGERWAVVGRSGSGKTTLVRAVLGLLPAGSTVTGSIEVDGREIVGRPERELRALRGRAVGYVPQDPFAACDPLRSVGHHVEEAWRAHRLPTPTGAVVGGLAEVDIAAPEVRARHHPHHWSGGMLQRATIVAATAHEPPLTLADEPTSALDTELADDVLHTVRRRCGALLLISHDLALVARHADQVVVLADGREVDRGRCAELLSTPTVLVTRSLVEAAVPPPRRVPSAPGGEPVAEVRGVSRHYGPVTAIDDVSLTQHRGEIVGIVGRSGSGKSTLARLVAGLERPDSGTVTLDGQSTRRRLRPGYVMSVFQDPVASLDRRWPLWRTLAEPVRARGAALTRDAAARALADVGLDLDLDRRPGSLSVGQAQRVAIARALLAEPALLVADEPTASLDVATAAAITDLLRGLADRGAALLVVSHDRARLAGYADRVLTMRDGRLE